MRLNGEGMDSLIVQPRPELRPFVRAYLQRRTSRDNAPVVETCTMRLEQFLRFEFDNLRDEIAIFGPCSSAHEYIHVQPDTDT